MLKPYGKVPLSNSSGTGGLDHADIHLPTGRVFVANTANNSVEVIDGISLSHIKTINGCEEASGVLCPQGENTVFAASRGNGLMLVIDPVAVATKDSFTIGSKPNGLAFDGKRKNLLLADVLDNTARLVDITSSEIVGTCRLPGRPRWCVLDSKNDRFLVNIKEPSGITILGANDLKLSGNISISSQGAHGLELGSDQEAYVACDSGELVKVDMKNGSESKTKIQLSGPPDVLWLNQKSGILYCAIGKPGRVDVIDAKAWKLVDSVPTEAGAHTLTFDQDRQLLYVFLPKSSEALVFKEE
jgi:DNA-binding beta-propeller fold protein YncE